MLARVLLHVHILLCVQYTVQYGIIVGLITINVPLFKKLRDIIFFWCENHFMSHFEGHFEGAKTFFFRGQKSRNGS